MAAIAWLARNNSGATAIEYALIAGIVSLAIITATGVFGGQVTVLFQTVTSAF